jgi:SAM-dependent methyltransferase
MREFVQRVHRLRIFDLPWIHASLVSKDHWEEVGRIQFEFLLKEGLQPVHYLLDAGCGSFRGGRFFIKYLEAGHYVGVDKNRVHLDMGVRYVLRPARLLDKHPRLYAVEFTTHPQDLGALLRFSQFDYIWIHALFDHIPPEVIRQCLHDLTAILRTGGLMYATIFLNPHGPDFLEPMIRPRHGTLQDAVVTFPDREYWHQTIEFFKETTEQIPSLRLEECFYDYPHPLGLRILRFRREPQS